MKKVLLSLAICLLAVNVSFAQEDGILAQPTHFVAKRINVDGEITLALDADFSYDEEGKVVKDGERGEIVIKGENVMAGYWKNLESLKKMMK